jgi:hypothetical protein
LDLVLTSLGGLALLSTGSTHKEGRYSPQIKKALRYILKRRLKKPLGTIASHENCALPFALLFLSEIQRIDPQKRIKILANKIIKRLEKNQ